MAASPAMLPAALAACQACNSLEELNVSSNANLQDVHLQAILGSAARLKRLDASGCSGLRSAPCLCMPAMFA